MPCITIYGKMGSNKSLFATRYAIFLANKFKKKYIISNYPLNLKELYNYCYRQRFDWCCKRLRKGNFIYYLDFSIEGGKIGLDNILSKDNSIVLFDETALYLPARGSSHSTTKTSQFHKELTQIRHRKNYLIAIAQNHQQIDSMVRNLAEEIFHCSGFTAYDNRLEAPRLMYKTVHRFAPDNYDVWVSNPKNRKNPIKTRLLRNKDYSGNLTRADIDLFKVFSSFGLVHESASDGYKFKDPFWILPAFKGKDPIVTPAQFFLYDRAPALPRYTDMLPVSLPEIPARFNQDMERYGYFTDARVYQNPLFSYCQAKV